ncbi:uncharacterized protein LOC132734901 [Ruditapes philippinarum]|uniref:uncharacterized protein LOC132734901 n=1 Tax=Ruditapes philippinarum TaxID=129788 RepID=UPI00295B1494|nr:uncharacterized protein LOC132734901 [Ruditapes philippinarum]
MRKMDLFFLSILVTVFQASWSYYVSNSTLTWSRKSDECNTRVATPTIHYGHTDLIVDMNGQTTEQKVWVGYYQQTTLFEYIGCMSSEDLNISKIQLGTSNIGRCYSACSNTPFIGIDRQMCYCMQVKPEKDMRKLGCISGCSDTHNAACGGNNFTSVYRILPHNDSRQIPEKQEYSKSCLIVHINSEKNITSVYGWRRCSVNIWVFCTSDSDQSVKVHEEKKSWRDAATMCFRKHGYPTGYKDVRNATYVGIYGWTGIVWSDVIYKDTDLEYSNNSSDISYGYLEYDSSVGHVLNFSKEDTRKYILCNGKGFY